MATIFYPNGATKQVKNLGWLLRNWQGVHEILFEFSENNNKDGELIVLFKNGGKYVTDFACLATCFNFLNRPVFKGQNFTIYSNHILLSMWVIGDEKYKQTNKLEYSEQMDILLGKKVDSR